MSLNISKLKHVRARGTKTIARCPACAETEADKKGEHLVINANGKFGCVVYPGNSADAKAHRKRIFELCGLREIQPLIVHSKKSKKSYLGNAQDKPSAFFAFLPVREVKKNVLGVLIRTVRTPNLTSRADKIPKNADKNICENVSFAAHAIEERRLRRPRDAKKCTVCGAEYSGWPESEYCSNECAKQYDTSKNPSKERIKFLRQCCRRTVTRHGHEFWGPGSMLPRERANLAVVDR
jgi:hypothetical protein